jgi:hypothetical protein
LAEPDGFAVRVGSVDRLHGLAAEQSNGLELVGRLPIQAVF